MKIRLNENIKKLRLQKKLTQEALAEYLGVTGQSVSNWERGESYPDITLLPEIAEFFGVSVDCLLGAMSNENEKEIDRMLTEYDNIRNNNGNEEKKFQIISSLKQKYPFDFTVQLKYMEHIITFNITKQDKLKIKAEVMSIYNNILNNCTVDSIRISTKTQYIRYCFQLASIKNSGVTHEHCKMLISELPEMKDCRELFCLSHEEMRHTLQEKISLMISSVSDCYFSSSNREYQIECINKIIDFLDFIYDDGNYGIMWTFMINCCYGIRGLFHYQLKNHTRALIDFEKSAVLACEFDALDTVTNLKSTLLLGESFDKRALGIDFCAKHWLKDLFVNQYGLCEEFKATDEFKRIIDMIK